MPSSAGPNFLAVVTLLDPLDPKEYKSTQLPMILQDPDLSLFDNLFDLIGGIDGNMEFSRIVSKFLMDRVWDRGLSKGLAERGKETNTRSFFFGAMPIHPPPFAVLTEYVFSTCMFSVMLFLI